MTLVEIYNELRPYQKALVAFVPVFGIFLGWILKTLTDIFLRMQGGWRRRRKCTFYLLNTWKRVLDYERYVSLLSKQDVDVETFEASRGRIFNNILEHIDEGTETLKEGVRELASIDPTSAAQLDNTIHNFKEMKRMPLAVLSQQNPNYYLAVMKEHYEMIDWTLSDLSEQTKKLARKSGSLQRRKISKWFQARIDGKKEFEGGIKKVEDDYERRIQESQEEPSNPMPIVMPDYQSSANWKRFLELIPESESSDAPSYEVAAENLRKQEKALRELGLNCVIVSVSAEEWYEWVIKEGLEVSKKTVMDYAIWKHVSNQ